MKQRGRENMIFIMIRYVTLITYLFFFFGDFPGAATFSGRALAVFWRGF